MAQTLIENARGVLDDRVVSGFSLLLEDGVIINAAAGREKLLCSGPGSVRVDAGGAWLCPGFIDLHFHGMHRFLVDNGPADLAGICAALPAYGVTGFLPTVCPLPKGRDAEFLAGLAAAAPACAGTRILGFHLEGPFLSLTGALPPEALGADDIERVDSLVRAAAPYQAVFSISPEFPGICRLLPRMTANGAPAFITHTAANVEQTQAAIAAGACHATHFYDVFPAPAVRDPGVRPCGAMEAVMASSRTSVDFILDGEHVEPVAVQMALRCLGPDRVCLVTDANIGAGLDAGEYKFGAVDVVVARKGAPARLKASGGLAGSGLTMNLAVRNAVRLLGLELPAAVRLASANPARVLGLEKHKGALRTGYDADLVLLDNDFNVRACWVGGKLMTLPEAAQATVK